MHPSQINTSDRRVACALVAGMVAAAWSSFGAADSTTVYSVADDFSIVSNPAGPWSYGYTNGLGSPLILFVDNGVSGPLEGWFKNISLGAPGASHNNSPSTIVNGTVQYAPWQAIFHPGPTGQLCVFRFTAPSAGEYALNAAFSGADTWGTTTTVHILVAGEEIFNGAVTGFGPATGPNFSTAVQLEQGAIVDFAVSTANGFFNDSTGIDATLSVNDIPCPADLDGNGAVDAADLAILLGAWGTAGSGADLDSNGNVDAADLALLLGAWGLCV